jgi:hypothetical protein
VDKKEFIHVLHHFADSSAEEAQEVVSLKDNYPYSQLLHALSARVCKDHGFSNQQHELQLAAVYASDRSALKDIMAAEFRASSENSDFEVATIKSTHVKSTVLISPDNEEFNSEGVAEEIISDLERLHELKHNFELLFTDTPPSVTTNTAASSSNVETKSAKKEDEKVSAPKEKSGLSKKERIIALAKEADLKAEAEAKEKNTPASVGRKKKENTGDLLIDEIVSTKQEINPETEKQKEQIELINQFIQAQPSIVNREKTIAVPTGDLSTIKSGEFGDNIVSETLVDILLKQGKKDKAIEVLKKLIWKFPQKKAYFAAQIEELKK